MPAYQVVIVDPTGARRVCGVASTVKRAEQLAAWFRGVHPGCRVLVDCTPADGLFRIGEPMRGWDVAPDCRDTRMELQGFDGAA